MSGVFGFLQKSPNLLPLSVVEQMGRQMCHHPYYHMDTTCISETVGLGRVNIGRLNGEPQPVRSSDGNIWLLLSGEFYHQESRREALVKLGALAHAADDTQFALQVYIREGTSGLTNLEGAFTLALWDKRLEELIIVNDRFGLYPHYYAHAGSAFAFAPEIKGVLGVPLIPRKLNQTAIAEYLRFQQILGEKTWFEDIKLLPPSSLLRYHPTRDLLILTCYWDWDTIRIQQNITFNEAVEESKRLFQRGINAMIKPPGRIGIYLSGGLDGRTILGFVGRQIPVTTITYGAPGCRDVLYAAKLAQKAGSKHYWFPFNDGKWVAEQASLHLALTEGMHSWMHAHGMSTLSEARELVDVNLSGWDGGTIFGGYLDSYEEDYKYRHTPNETELSGHLYNAFCYKFTWPGLTDAEASALLCDPSLGKLALESFNTEFSRTAHYPADRRADYFYILQHVRRSTQNMIVFTRSAIEVRCPFFDYNFVNFIYSLPDYIRTSPKLYRTVITQRMPHLAMVPNEKDNRLPHINPLIYHSYGTLQRGESWINRNVGQVFPQPRRTRLYADYENYLRNELRVWAETILFAQDAQERGLFNTKAVKSLWQNHLEGNEQWTIGKIAPLITLEMVLSEFYNKKLPGDAS